MAFKRFYLLCKWQSSKAGESNGVLTGFLWKENFYFGIWGGEKAGKLRIQSIRLHPEGADDL
jgi:hypothetical protein